MFFHIVHVLINTFISSLSFFRYLSKIVFFFCVAADLQSYSGQIKYSAREILARNKDFVTTKIKPEPKYLGEVIPVSGNGNITNDKY